MRLYYQMLYTFKKPILVLANSALTIVNIMEDNISLKIISCIHYPVWFKKDKIKALINFDSKVNIVFPRYAWKLSLKVYYPNMRFEKIDGSILEIFKIVLASF